MIQDMKFLLNCKVVPIYMQFEILKKKYPEHIFYKQDVYNTIYKLHNDNKDEKPDFVLLLNILFEKYLKIHAERFLFDMKVININY
jgi:hypothetical protein